MDNISQEGGRAFITKHIVSFTLLETKELVYFLQGSCSGGHWRKAPPVHSGKCGRLEPQRFLHNRQPRLVWFLTTQDTHIWVK